MTLNHILAQFDAITNDPRFLGFDSLFDRVERNLQHGQETYPPHNVVYDKNEDEEESYIIELALAGYKEDNINVRVQDDQLTIEGNQGDDKRTYHQKGIAGRKFKKSFTLGEYLVVRKAVFENGLLSVHIDKVIPEEKKPRNISINGKKEEKKTFLSE
jgi:molecular chaperone IbpA